MLFSKKPINAFCFKKKGLKGCAWNIFGFAADTMRAGELDLNKIRNVSVLKCLKQSWTEIELLAFRWEPMGLG